MTDNDRMRNKVLLCGRVSMAPDERSLPSGDTVLSTRIVVERPGPALTAASDPPRRRVDAIDCVAWTARVRRTMRHWRPGDQVRVEGALRRRFYRGSSGPVSRFEVEVERASRLSAATKEPPA